MAVNDACTCTCASTLLLLPLYLLFVIANAGYSLCTHVACESLHLTLVCL
jgi:hypothetical protein